MSTLAATISTAGPTVSIQLVNSLTPPPPVPVPPTPPASSTTIIWPSWLQPLREGFSWRFVDNVVRYNSIVGPPAQGIRSSILYQMQNWRVLLTKDNLDDFETFWQQTTKQGTLYARGLNPVDGSRVLMRLARVGRYEPMNAPDVFVVRCTVEVYLVSW